MKKPKVRLLAYKVNEIYTIATFSVDEVVYVYRLYERDLDRVIYLLGKGWLGRALLYLKKNGKLMKGGDIVD